MQRPRRSSVPSNINSTVDAAKRGKQVGYDKSVAASGSVRRLPGFRTLSPLETAEESSASVAWKEGGKKEEKKGVPVYVMMPLDSVTNVNRKKAMNAMIDVWWGLVEREAPGALTIGVATRSFSRWLRSMALKSRLSCHSISVGATSVTLARSYLLLTSPFFFFKIPLLSL
ncbi:hypothetical protein ES319_D10G179400v1 [Gossypium barbadense]|uniref:Uncharacterized protein n=1 Tax=Gossypium barbadense TaxID=3634 RepID=A0A5J5PT24_GOSBA|nr:hypothetical protein ES319_D10G179400v1 [Gossypium barbadense]